MSTAALAFAPTRVGRDSDDLANRRMVHSATVATLASIGGSSGHGGGSGGGIPHASSSAVSSHVFLADSSSSLVSLRQLQEAAVHADMQRVLGAVVSVPRVPHFVEAEHANAVAQAQAEQASVTKVLARIAAERRASMQASGAVKAAPAPLDFEVALRRRRSSGANAPSALVIPPEQDTDAAASGAETQTRVAEDSAATALRVRRASFVDGSSELLRAEMARLPAREFSLLPSHGDFLSQRLVDMGEGPLAPSLPLLSMQPLLFDPPSLPHDPGLEAELRGNANRRRRSLVVSAVPLDSAPRTVLALTSLGLGALSRATKQSGPPGPPLAPDAPPRLVPRSFVFSPVPESAAATTAAAGGGGRATRSPRPARLQRASSEQLPEGVGPEGAVSLRHLINRQASSSSIASLGLISPDAAAALEDRKRRLGRSESWVDIAHANDKGFFRPPAVEIADPAAHDEAQVQVLQQLKQQPHPPSAHLQEPSLPPVDLTTMNGERGMHAGGGVSSPRHGDMLKSPRLRNLAILATSPRAAAGVAVIPEAAVAAAAAAAAAAAGAQAATTSAGTLHTSGDQGSPGPSAQSALRLRNLATLATSPRSGFAAVAAAAASSLATSPSAGTRDTSGTHFSPEGSPAQSPRGDDGHHRPHDGHESGNTAGNSPQPHPPQTVRTFASAVRFVISSPRAAHRFRYVPEDGSREQVEQLLAEYDLKPSASLDGAAAGHHRPQLAQRRDSDMADTTAAERHKGGGHTSQPAPSAVGMRSTSLDPASLPEHITQLHLQHLELPRYLVTSHAPGEMSSSMAAKEDALRTPFHSLAMSSLVVHAPKDPAIGQLIRKRRLRRYGVADYSAAGKRGGGLATHEGEGSSSHGALTGRGGGIGGASALSPRARASPHLAPADPSFSVGSPRPSVAASSLQQDHARPLLRAAGASIVVAASPGISSASQSATDRIGALGPSAAEKAAPESRPAAPPPPKTPVADDDGEKLDCANRRSSLPRRSVAELATALDGVIRAASGPVSLRFGVRMKASSVSGRHGPALTGRLSAHLDSILSREYSASVSRIRKA